MYLFDVFVFYFVLFLVVKRELEAEAVALADSEKAVAAEVCKNSIKFSSYIKKKIQVLL